MFAKGVALKKLVTFEEIGDFWTRKQTNKNIMQPLPGR